MKNTQRRYFLKFADDTPAKEVDRLRWLNSAEANGFYRKDQKEPLGFAAENIYGFTLLTSGAAEEDKLDKTLEAFLAKGTL